MSRVVALSGAGGFIGTHLARALERNGDTVVALRRTGAALVAPNVSRLDAVVHLAFPASVAERRDDPPGALHSAIGTTLSALEIARACGAPHLLLASSGKVYASPPDLPIDEDHAVAPRTWLGELKLACEQMVGLSVRRGTALGATVLRIFNVYGPGQSADFVVPHLLSGVGAAPLPIGELHHARDYVHVDDVCRAFIAALAHVPMAGRTRVVNVGSGRAATVAELAALIERATGSRLKLVVDPSRRRPGESPEERARCAVLADWRAGATIPLERGIAALARENPGAVA